MQNTQQNQLGEVLITRLQQKYLNDSALLIMMKMIIDGAYLVAYLFSYHEKAHYELA